MKILYVTINSHLRSTTCVLDAIVSTMSPKEVHPVFVFPEAGPWQKSLIPKGIQTYIKSFFIPAKKKPLQFIASFLSWAWIIKKHHIRIIHLNEHEYYPMLKYVARFLDVPIVVGVRFVLTGGYAKWAFSGNYKPHKLLFTSQDQLKRSKVELPQNISENDICVIGNGRDLDALTGHMNKREETRQSWAINSNTILLGTASVIRPRKRLEDFVEVVEKLVKEGFDVKGIIAGGGKFSEPSYYDKLESSIHQKGLHEHILMLGNVEDVHVFYQAIDLFLSTSELETFGMSVCEAMAFGLPVIGYKAGSVGEVLGDNRYIVNDVDPNLLFQKTREFIATQDKMNFFSSKNKERAFTLYNAPIISQNIYDIYQEIVTVSERK